MTIYKVPIKTEGNTTTYTTNDAILATVEYRSELDKYEVSMHNGSALADTEPEAQNIARESIKALFATLGIMPLCFRGL